MHNINSTIKVFHIFALWLYYYFAVSVLIIFSDSHAEILRAIFFTIDNFVSNIDWSIVIFELLFVYQLII